MPEPLAIYVHWPWCKHKCPYCDFNSHASPPQEEDYIQALEQELTYWKEILPSSPIVSIYFGGGTPSLMKAQNIGRIIKACSGLGCVSSHTEITVECNPTSTAASYLRELRAEGVNRVSIGLQGLKDEWLTFLGRQHTVSESLQTLTSALSLFPRVNADVIYGLPDQSQSEWENQLRYLCDIGPAHISAYQLTVEPHTRFFSDVKRGKWAPLSDDAEAAFFECTQQILCSFGYQNYEISNFCKADSGCAHNIHVWNYGSYIGIGAGAHGRPYLLSGQRLATAVIKQPYTYLERISTHQIPFIEHEPLTQIQQLQERLFLGLRLQEGIPLSLIPKHTQNGLYEEAIDCDGYAYVLQSQLLEEVDGHLRLTKQGWPLLNGILRNILRSA